MEKTPEIRYLSPAEEKVRYDEYSHTFSLIIDEEIVSAAHIEYLSKPLPIYQVSQLYTLPNHQGRGYASQLMTQVEIFLKTRKKPGVLVDALHSRSLAQGMYQRRGWIEIPGSHGLLVFNWPKDVDMSILKNYPDRYTQLSDRKE
jgi:GNAT superfamily N-acetyltransferase